MHAIIVHDGQDAVSGHYYSFIYDRASDLWWRFNDHTASQETEEVVMQEALGGNDQKCAYSLIYVKQDVADQLQKTPFTSYTKTLSSVVAASLRKQAQESNMRFDKELIDYEVEKITKRVADKLKARTEILRQQTENHHMA